MVSLRKLTVSVVLLAAVHGCAHQQPRGRSGEIAVLGSGAIRLLEEGRSIDAHGAESFCWTADGRGFIWAAKGALWLLPRKGGRVRELVGGWDRVRSPQVSPDGQRIVFVGYREGEPPTMWIAGHDGTDPQPLVAGHEPAWSADGSAVLFEQYTDGPRLYVHDLESGTTRRYAPHPVLEHLRAHDVECSPDGRRVALSSGGSLHLYDVTSDTVRVLTGGEYYDQGVSFSPDGRRIVFTRRRKDPRRGRVEPRIVLMDLATGKHEVIDRPGGEQAVFAPR